jgi:cytokinin dehydrogenase
MTVSSVMGADVSRRAPFEKLPPLDGTLLLDEATRRLYSQDYGGVVHKQPLAVLQPRSLEDIARMVRFAHRYGLRIAVRGQGHQPFGQSQVAGGVVIDMRSLRTVHSVTADRLDVDAGAEWRDVVQAALRRGLTPPVLPAYLGLTVGGTLSVGGIGPATFRHGAQVDQALELEVVTGEGNIMTCSEVKHRDLFDAALAGQGQCAIITRAVTRLVPASTMIREYVARYTDLPTLLQDGMRLTEEGRFDGVFALIVPSGGQWSFTINALRQFTPPSTLNDAAPMAGLRYIAGSEQTRDVGYLQYVDGMPKVEFGASHPDLGLCIPGSATASFLTNTLRRLTPDELGTVSGIRMFFWKQGPFRRPLFRIPREQTFAYIAMLRTETSDSKVAAQMLAGNRTLFERNRDLGGTYYAFSALALSQRDWQQHYGAQWPALVEAKLRYDPHHVFASGPDLSFH